MKNYRLALCLCHKAAAEESTGNLTKCRKDWLCEGLWAVFNKASACSVQREKIHNNAEKLICHPLHVACTSVHIPTDRLKHISSSLFVSERLYVVLLPWWDYLLPHRKPFFSQSIDIFSHVSIRFWFDSDSSFYQSPLTLLLKQT